MSFAKWRGNPQQFAPLAVMRLLRIEGQVRRECVRLDGNSTAMIAMPNYFKDQKLLLLFHHSPMGIRTASLD